MDFVIDNYIIIIVVAVILIMALIGYLAEKTDFIHENKEKKQKRKKRKEKEPKEEIPAPQLTVPTSDQSPIAEVNSTADSLGFEDPFAMSSDTVNAPKIEQPLPNIPPIPDQPIPATNSTVDQSLYAPIEKPKFGEDFTSPNSVNATESDAGHSTLNVAVEPLMKNVKISDQTQSLAVETSNQNETDASQSGNDAMDEWKI